MRHQLLIAAFLSPLLVTLPACSKKESSKRSAAEGGGGATDPSTPGAQSNSGTTPSSGPTPDSPAPGSTPSTSGTIAVSFGDTLVGAINASLIDNGLPADVVNKISGEVVQSGVVAAGSLRLFSLDSAEANDAKDLTGPIVAAYLKESNGDLDATQTQTLIGAAIEAGAKAAHEKGGLDSAAMQSVMVDVTEKTMAAVPASGLSADDAAIAAGTAAQAVIQSVVPAGVPAAEFADAAAVIAAAVGEHAPAAVATDKVTNMMLSVGQSVTDGLKELALTDPVAGIGKVADGLMAGFVKAPLDEQIRLDTVGELPAGIAKGLSGFVSNEQLGDAVDELTLKSANAMFVGFPDVTGDRLADAAARIAGGPSRGFASGGVTSAQIVDGGLATRSLEAMLKTSIGQSSLDEASRQRFVYKAFESSVGGLAARNDAAFVESVATNFMTISIDTAARYAGNLGLGGTVDETKVQNFYGGIYQGAFNGMGAISDKSATVGASVLPRFAAGAMTATVDSLKTVVGQTQMSTNFLTNLPATASLYMGQSLATRLPPADLSTGFANVTGQYVNDVQAVVATRPSIDFNGLAKNVTGAALATFGGTFNASPGDMQDAAGILNAKLGTFKLDTAVYSAVLNGSSEIVVNAAKNANGGSLVICSAQVPDSLSNAEFMAKMIARPDLAVCLMGSETACPKTRTTDLVVYEWQKDPFGTQCASNRRPNVQVAVSCPTGQHFAYGAGCVPDQVDCAAGQTFMMNVGCQDAAFFCPAGQVFVAGNACTATTQTFSCAATQRYVASQGCVTNTVQTCAKGSHLEGTACVADAAIQCPASMILQGGMCVAQTTAGAPIVCPTGALKDAAGNCIAANVAANICPTGQYLDPTRQKCRPEGECDQGLTWDASVHLCRAATVAATCAAGQFFDSVRGGCVSEGNCAGATYWDYATKSCRSNATCPPNTIWNSETSACVAATTLATCTTCFGTRPDTPSQLTVAPVTGAVSLSWTAMNGAQGYALLRRSSAVSDGILVDGRAASPGDLIGDTRIIYMGPFPNFTDYAVTAGQTYHYAVAALNPSGAGPVFSTGLAKGSGSPLAIIIGNLTPPASFTARGLSGGVQLEWIPPGGSTLIVRRMGSEPTFTPTANTDYPIGQAVGNATIVVFRGDGDRYFDLASATGETYFYRAFTLVRSAAGLSYSSSTSYSATPTAGSTTDGYVSAPQASPMPGSFTQATAVTLVTTTMGAGIRYTLNGSTPTCASTSGNTYSGSIQLMASATIRAIACKTGLSDSSVIEISYDISGGDTVVAPVANPAPGSYGAPKDVVLTSMTLGSTIRYTTDGSTPTCSTSQVFNTKISVATSTSIRAIACKSGLTNSSSVQFDYTINANSVDQVTAGPSPGVYNGLVNVYLQTTTAGATIRYTTGSTINCSSGMLFTTATPIAVSTTTSIKAIACNGALSSSVGTYTYTIEAGAPSASVTQGIYENPIAVSLSSTTQGATIRYTTTGTAPTCGGSDAIFSSAIGVSSSMTIKAIACKDGSSSAVATYSYTIGGQLASPNASPSPGIYSGTQSVALSVPSGVASGAFIAYTIDGSTTPNCVNSTHYTTPLSISTTTTVRAIYCKSGLTSAVANFAYSFGSSAVSPPTASVNGGTYTAAQSVTLATTTPNATIRYTIDSTTPTCSSPATSGPINVPTTLTIRAVACANSVQSNESSFSYTIQPPVEMPTASVAPGTYNSTQSIVLSSATSGAAIYFTTDGSTPTTSSTLYSGAISVAATQTIKAFADKAGMTSSAVAAFTYTISAGVVIPPTASVDGTLPLTAATTLTFSSNTSGATIRYRTDNTDPTCGTGTVYSSPLSLTAPISYKVIACDGSTPSAVSAFTYTFVAAAPEASPPPGGFPIGTPQNVTLTSATAGATIRYLTTNATLNCSTGIVYTGSITVSADTVIKAIACKGGYVDSNAAMLEYRFGPLGFEVSPDRSDFVEACAVKNGGVICSRLGKDFTSYVSGSRWVIAANSGVSKVRLGWGRICAIVKGGVTCIEADGSTNTVYAQNSGITDLVVGAVHACVVKSGTVFCWGGNGAGQLGNNTTTNQTSPVQVNAALPASVVDRLYLTGPSTTCAVKTSGGNTYCWGQGRVGNGTSSNVLIPTMISSFTGMTSVTWSGVSPTEVRCAIGASGLACLGNNDVGQLGSGSTTSQSSPFMTISPLGSLKGVTTNGSQTCAVDGGGLRCWGLNAGDVFNKGAGVNNVTTPQLMFSNGTLTSVALLPKENGICYALSGRLDCAGYTYGNKFTAGSNRVNPDQQVGLVKTAISSGASNTDEVHVCWSNENDVLCSLAGNESGAESVLNVAQQ